MLVSGSVIVEHFQALRGVGGLILNADGKRFCNELGRTFAIAPMEDGWAFVEYFGKPIVSQEITDWYVLYLHTV